MASILNILANFQNKVCHEKVKTVIASNPVEKCNLKPSKVCRHTTKMVPKLKPVTECVDVPKEICAKSRVNPKRVKKPSIQKWCYMPDTTNDTTSSSIYNKLKSILERFRDFLQLIFSWWVFSWGLTVRKINYFVLF